MLSDLDLISFLSSTYIGILFVWILTVLFSLLYLYIRLELKSRSPGAKNLEIKFNLEVYLTRTLATALSVASLISTVAQIEPLNPSTGSREVIVTLGLVILFGIVVSNLKQKLDGFILMSHEAEAKPEDSPKLTAALHMAHVTYVTLKIQNIGKGPATDVNLEIAFSKNNSVIETRPFKRKTMMALEDAELILPDGMFSSLLDSITKIDVKGSYKDTSEGNIQMQESIDISEFVDSITKSRQMWREEDASIKAHRPA